MIVTNLFPRGMLQFVDVLNNGYWHARSTELLHTRLMQRIEWLRMPADLIFVVLGVVPLILAMGLKYVPRRE